jgi:hypothetical protein
MGSHHVFPALSSKHSAVVDNAERTVPRRNRTFENEKTYMDKYSTKFQSIGRRQII